MTAVLVALIVLVGMLVTIAVASVRVLREYERAVVFRLGRLIGRVGEVRSSGQVFLDGALWRARAWSPDDEEGLQRGDPIVVERVDGLTLTVRRAEEWEVAP